MDILLIEDDLRVLNMYILLVMMMNIHLVQWRSLWPILPKGLGNKTTVCEPGMGRHNCVPKRRKVASFTQAPDW